eukprot:Nk52_evm49s359 gene=Nk52_evmTU49s359
MPSTKKSDNNEIYNEAAVAKNMQIMSFSRTMASAAGGVAAGIIGLTNTYGIAFYFVVFLVTSAALHLKVEASKKTKDAKFVKSSGDLWLDAFGGATTYILFWTLVYGIVHVY